MDYKILTGEEFEECFLEKIMEIDRECYESEYVGELANMVARYRQNRRSFVCVMDGDTVAGYINFFPVVPDLWNEIVETGMDIKDDDILPDEIVEFKEKKKYNLYILSVAVREKYRNQKQVIKTLTDGFIQYLNTLEGEGFLINAISGTAVTNGGRKFLRNCMFGERREINGGNIVYVCEGDYLRKLLNNDLYFKTYKDDAYLFIPYVEHPENHRLDELIEAARAEKEERKRRAQEEEEDDFAEVVDNAKLVETLRRELYDCWDYEFQSDVVKEVTRIYLGEFDLMHTLDDAYEDDGSAPKHIVGEEKVYLSLLAHKPSHMYIAMIFVPDCQYSTSQLEDQVCQECLFIRKKEEAGSKDEQGYYIYSKLNDYLQENFGLMQCGKGKSIVCMSKKPDTEQEFYNILTAESYNSMRQGFHINYKRLRAAANTNRAIYDYYEAYMTEAVVAIVLNDYDTGSTERVKLMATYVFIVEMVMFQNIALNRVINKVTNALSHDGDVDYDYIMQINDDYAKTMKFWQNNNFKYLGTQREADQIRRAFDNDELRAHYRQQQDFLEHMVEVKDARAEHRNGLIMNFALFALAIMEVRDYAVELLIGLYENVGFGIVPKASAFGTFDAILFGFGPLIVLIMFTRKKKRDHKNQRKLRNSKWVEEYDE